MCTPVIGDIKGLEQCYDAMLLEAVWHCGDNVVPCGGGNGMTQVLPTDNTPNNTLLYYTQWKVIVHTWILWCHSYITHYEGQ